MYKKKHSLSSARNNLDIFERDHVQGITHNGGEPLAAFFVPVVVHEFFANRHIIPFFVLVFPDIYVT